MSIDVFIIMKLTFNKYLYNVILRYLLFILIPFSKIAIPPNSIFSHLIISGKLSRLTIVSREAKKKQAVRDK